MFEINEKELLNKRDSDDFYETAMDMFTERRRIVSLEIKGRGKSIQQMEQKNLRPFSKKPNELAVFSLQYGASCHEILFGNKKMSMLPKTMSEMLYLFRDLSILDRESVIAYISTMTSEWKASNAKERENLMLSVDHTRMMRYRLGEIAHDCAESLYRLVPNSYHILDNYMTRDNFCAFLNSLMMLAMCLDTTVDQFCCVDYTALTDLRIFDSDEVVRDEGERRFVQQYLIAQYLDHENEAKIIQYILSLNWHMKYLNTKLILNISKKKAESMTETFGDFGLSAQDGMLLLYDLFCKDRSVAQKLRDMRRYQN